MATIAPMELYQLKTFVAIAQERSLTRAAERVFTSPPAVSAQIKALEDELGVKLFDRTPRGMVLTEAGARLLEEAEHTLASAGRMRSTAEQLRGAARGVVRFGAVGDPVALRLGTALVTLAERHPHIALQLHQGVASTEALNLLQRGELDCAYVMTDREHIDGLELRRLGRMDLVVALPLAAARGSTHPSRDEVLALPWVGTPTNCVLRNHLDALFASAGREYREGTMANSESMVRSLVASGAGAGIVWRDQALHAERAGELAVWNGWHAHTWVCWAAPLRPQAPEVVDAVRGAVFEAWACA